MKYSLFKQENYKTSRWTGGATKELAIFPETADYLERNFIWRLSSAQIEKEEASFSRLPDYDRVLMVLEGEVVLSYEGQRVARLKELEQDRFDGEWKTVSFGKITDYNLMVRKGSEGYLDIIFPEKESKTYRTTEESSKCNSTHALYCKDGYAVVVINGDTCMLKEGEQLVIEGEEGENLKYDIMGEGTLIRAQIFYGDAVNEVGPEIIPREKATFGDFKTCIYLANVQFRWAKYIVKSLRTIWFDQELSAAIRKVEKFYITAVIFILGFAGLIGLLANGIVSSGVCFAMMAGWVLIDCLIISPGIYMMFMPKPVRKHIKNVDTLTPYEERVRNEELAANPALEKVMKKYKNSGRNLGK